MDTLSRLPFKARKAVFEKLEQIVDIAALSKEERMKYDESIKVYRDHLATIAFAKTEGKAEGRAEGRAEGLAEGLAEGRAEGLAEGRAEGRAEVKLATARNLKALNVAPDIIMQATGLSFEEIEKL